MKEGSVKERIFEVDYNRPLSLQEIAIVSRLDCEPEPRTGLGEVLQEQPARLPSTCPVCGLGFRWTENSCCSANRARLGTQPGFDQ